MNKKESFISFNTYGWHKGFYCEQDMLAALEKIKYEDFFEHSASQETPNTADLLLCGACNNFAIALQNVMGYTPYIIKETNANGFHAFCQVHKAGRWHYIDARGVTTSFDEFMKVASEFVGDEYTINPITPDMIAEWDEDCSYKEEAYSFSEAIIRKFEKYYMI